MLHCAVDGFCSHCTTWFGLNSGSDGGKGEQEMVCGLGGLGMPFCCLCSRLYMMVAVDRATYAINAYVFCFTTENQKLFAPIIAWITVDAVMT